MRYKTLLVLGILVAGCGTVSGEDPTKYEGTWTYDSGMIKGDCGFMSASQDLTGNTMTLTKGQGADLMAGTTDCEIKFNMSGSKAVAPAGQMCTINVMGIGALVVTIDSWTLETTDGMTMTGDMKGKTQVPLPNPPGGSLGCAVTGTGALTKQP